MFSLPITAKANELTRYNSNNRLQRGKADSVKKWSVIDENSVKHDLSMDYKNMIITIDNEEIEIIEEKIALSKATVDYNTASKFSAKIPWKGSVTLLAAAIGGLVSGGDVAGWAATIAGAITADAENIYLTMTQYRSKEKYWSSYNGVYYNKAINKDITFRQSSSNGKLLCGPVQGSWFDPIRPYDL